MIIRKSIDFFERETKVQKGWEQYQPIIPSHLNEQFSTNNVRNKGSLRLVLGIFYFLSLVSALTVLLI